MTLKEWCEVLGIIPTPLTDKDYCSICYNWTNNLHHTKLWHLSDYRVISVSGVVIWLQLKENK
jgi:hypothetical protein